MTTYAERPELERILGLQGLGLSNLVRLLDGAVVETISITVTESGGTVSLNLEQSGGGDLTFLFGGVAYVLDCTPAQSIALTDGTGGGQINYVYVTESGGVLTLEKSTTDWPSGSHSRIATVKVQAPADVAVDGAMKVHAWTDHIYNATENGHVPHINAKLRALNATWVSGVSPADLASDQISTTAGVIFQLHTHTMPARDMSSGDPIFVTNDNTTPFKRITDFGGGGIDELSDGTPITNNRYVNLVVWGIVSEAEADCKLCINLPDADYTSEANAQADTDNTASYSFGSDFVGVGFLIARYVLRYSTAGGGTFTQSQKVDLRGLEPSTSPGGGAITDHGNLAGLTDDDHTQYLLTDGTRDNTGNQKFVGITMEGTVSMDGNRIDFDSTDDTSLRAASDNEITVETAGTDTLVISLDKIESAPVTAAAGRDFTLKAGDGQGIGNAGGDLLLEAGDGAVGGADGDVKLVDPLDCQDKTVTSVGNVLIAHKASDTNRSSTTTLADDPDLVVAMQINTTYVVEGVLFCTADSGTPDIKIAVTVPAGATFKIAMVSHRHNGTTTTNRMLQSSGTAGVIAINTSTHGVYFSGSVQNAGVAGNFAVQWAQNTSSGDNTTMESESRIVLTDTNYGNSTV